MRIELLLLVILLLVLVIFFSYKLYLYIIINKILKDIKGGNLNNIIKDINDKIVDKPETVKNKIMIIIINTTDKCLINFDSLTCLNKSINNKIVLYLTFLILSILGILFLISNQVKYYI